MIDKIRAKYKLLKKAKTDEECVSILNNIISSFNEVTQDWTQWKLHEIIELCEKNSKRHPVCRDYARQFTKFIMDKYLELPEEYKDVDMLYVIYSMNMSFKSFKYSFIDDLFTKDEWILDWFISDVKNLDITLFQSSLSNKFNKKIEQDAINDKFIIIENLIRGGRKGKNVGMLKRVLAFRDYMSDFPAFDEKCKRLIEAAEENISEFEFKYLYEKCGMTQYFFRTPVWFIEDNIGTVSDEIRENWKDFFNRTDVRTDGNKMSWCVRHIMPYTVAINQKKIGISSLAKIFRFKRSQKALINTPDLMYAMPEIITFASKREHHESLCVEIKEILGYDTTPKESEEKNLVAV